MAETDKTKTRNSKRKRPRRRPRTEFADYVLEIKEWNWDFSFGVNSMKDGDGPYHDFRHLQLRGTLVLPSKLKADGVEFYFLPERALNEDKQEDHEPKSVGSINRQRGNLEALLSMPSNVLPAVLQMLIGERFHFAVLHSERLRYGHAPVRSYRLEMTLDEVDMPVDT
jgi:hypothetical protein